MRQWSPCIPLTCCNTTRCMATLRPAAETGSVSFVESWSLVRNETAAARLQPWHAPTLRRSSTTTTHTGMSRSVWPCHHCDRWLRLCDARLHAEQHWDFTSHRWKNGRVSATPLVALGTFHLVPLCASDSSLLGIHYLCVVGWDAVLQQWGRARDPSLSAIGGPKVGSKRLLMTSTYGGAPQDKVARVLSAPPWTEVLLNDGSLPLQAAGRNPYHCSTSHKSTPQMVCLPYSWSRGISS
jgi:hypothetical protein